MKSSHKTITLSLLLVAATGLAPLAAQESPESPAALREQIHQLDQKLRILERNLELKGEAADTKAKSLPAISIGEKGFSATSADKEYSLKVGILTQADARFFFDDGADNRDTFLLRRIRVPFSGTVGKIFNFNITPEFAQADNSTATSNNQNTQLVDAWVDARLDPAFGLKVGKFRSPVVLEGPDPRHLLEATYTNQLAPNRDIGIEAFGAFADKLVAYKLGVYNGAPNNSWSSTTNSIDGDFSIAGRLTVDPFLKSDTAALKGLSLSLGGSFGNEDGNANSIRSPGQQGIVGAVTTDGRHFRIAPAVEWYYDSFSAIAEFIYESTEIAGGETVENTGWHISGGWVLTGEKATKSGVVPAAPFSLAQGTFGAFELVARVSGLDVDDDAFTGHGGPLNPATSASGAFSVGGGFNWYLNNNILVRFNVEWTDFDGGTSRLLNENELYAFTRVQLKF